MAKRLQKLIFLLVALAILGFFLISFFSNSSPKQFIFIGVDGLQVKHFNLLLNSNKLGNFSNLIGQDGWNGVAEITGHVNTETAPGNAEIFTGLGENVTGIKDNSCNKSIPSGYTVFERLKKFNPNILIGAIYGKGTCYIPDSIFKNASYSFDLWKNKTNYPNTDWVTENCADSRNVTIEALKFISLHKKESFFLVIYLGVPDCAGHTYGENSSQYEEAIINVDDGIGILLNGLNDSNMTKVQIMLSADHGWNINTKNHYRVTEDTKIIPLLTNNKSLTKNVFQDNLRKQCDITPTILNFFGMDKSRYEDIINGGCNSMIG